MIEMGIHSAASNGDIETLIDILSENKSVVNDVNQFGMTPLHGAVFHGQLEAARILLEYGANSNHPSSGEKYTFPLHLATSRLHKPLIELLLVEGGADPAAKDYLGHTVLNVAQAICVENDSVATDPETNIKFMNFIKECIVKAAQTTHQPVKSFTYESKHATDKNVVRHPTNVTESLSDSGDFDQANERIEPEIRNTQIMSHFFKSGIL